jgi:serralysin
LNKFVRESASFGPASNLGLSDAHSAAGASALPFLLEDYAGVATWSGKPIYNHDQVINQIDSGAQISGKTITFSFFDGPHTIGLYNNPIIGFSEPAGYSPMSDAEKTVARQSMVLWDDLIAPSVVEKTGNGADIVLANTTTGPAQAWTYYPGNGHKYQGDVWSADPTVNWSNEWLGYGGYGRTTLVHEIGHSLGLSHPGDYNYSDDNNGDGVPDPITYEGDAFYAQDTQQFSIMSYFSDQKSGGQAIDVSLGLLQNPQTPLLHDILTIQSKYGADANTRSGDTVYFAHSTAGNGVYDLGQNPFPYLSVYDAGGNDTFDFSTANSGVFLDLRPGSFSSATAGYQTMEQANAAIDAFNAVTDASQGDFAHWTHDLGDPNNYEDWVGFVQSIGASRVRADTGVSGITATSDDNISIAYNTIIENAIGGSARDYLVGNDVANQLSGNGGNDVLYGLKGNDTLNGGAGNDLFVFDNDGSTDTIADFQTGGDKIDLHGVAGATSGWVTYNSATHQVAIDTDHNGVADMFINSMNSVATGDIIFHA